jgi:hypothetical protein
MQEIACPNCGRRIKGQAELCLFCGKRLDGAADGGEAAETRAGFPFWVLVVAGAMILLCCGLTAQSGAISGVTTRLQDFAASASNLAEATHTLVPTNTPVPTPTSTPTPTPTPEPTSTPAPTLTPTPEPTPTPTHESMPTPTPPTPLLPDTGRTMGWRQAVWVIGMAMLLFGWGWSWLWHRLKGGRDRSQS